MLMYLLVRISKKDLVDRKKSCTFANSNLKVKLVNNRL